MAGQPTKSQFAQIEEEILDLWDKEKTFEESLKQREGAPYYSFYDGPPFANGLPHFGHSLVTSIKDSMMRYKTMRGYYVPRRNGWDCHGLPVEYAIEKELGVSGKKQIVELGIEKFNAACRDSIFKYKADWEVFMKRIGRWSEYENYYATVDRDYTESVWWVLREIHKKGLLYRGYKSMPYCPRCETPLSNFEVNDGYKDNVPDPSLYVKFKLTDEDAYLLGWTTTPWSLPGDAAIAINPKEHYAYVRHTTDEGQEETLVLAKKRLSILDERDFTVLKEVNGQDLVGKTYEPLFKVKGLEKHPNQVNLYKVWPAQFVTIEDGSGVLHVAPAFGEDDLSLAEDNDIPVLSTVDRSGHLTPDVGLEEIIGMFFKKADKFIIEYLTKQNAVFAAETIQHTYPFCWRCETPLLYYAITAWFIKVSGIKPELLKSAEEINWTPAHIKNGRFGKWLEGARDWGISRNRYWGAPMPIWVNENDENDYIVVGSTTELKELAGEDIKIDDLHRPFSDAISFTKDGNTYRRVEEVLDCWFESGSMAVAQQHYPFANKEVFSQTFPADFIIEGLDQTSQWFYVQHVVATILFGGPAYKNVIANGMIMAADGQKLSKRLKNYPPTDDVFDQEGADSWRLYLLSSTQATEAADCMKFDRAGMKDMQRNVLGTLWNTYKFFKMYADIDKWQPPNSVVEPKSASILDQWLLSRLSQTIQEVTKSADKYKIAHAIQPIFNLIDDLSNWYVRRSRRRFWKSEDDQDKQQAYATLHYALISVSQLLAPWAPFISDKIYRELTNGTTLVSSVHLTDWPKEGSVDSAVLEHMAYIRGVINEGLSQRATAGIKVRQPLQELFIKAAPKFLDDMDQEYINILQDELNVKAVFSNTLGGVHRVTLNTEITPELKVEGLMRELTRCVQSARKEAGLQVDDRIELSLDSKSKDVNQAVKQYAEVIKHETLALKLEISGEPLFTKEVKVDGEAVTVSLTKAK